MKAFTTLLVLSLSHCISNQISRASAVHAVQPWGGTGREERINKYKALFNPDINSVALLTLVTSNVEVTKDSIPAKQLATCTASAVANVLNTTDGTLRSIRDVNVNNLQASPLFESILQVHVYSTFDYDLYSSYSSSTHAFLSTAASIILFFRWHLVVSLVSDINLPYTFALAVQRFVSYYMTVKFAIDTLSSHSDRRHDLKTFSALICTPHMSTHQAPPELTVLQNVCKEMIDVPYCTGTVQLTSSQSQLFYQANGEARSIDFSNPTEQQLEALANACPPASFGRNEEDVLDENYRKAGKLDTTDFAAQFSPWNSGVLKTAVESLFKKEDSMADVTAELYKLNVYGPGSFFKRHVDTPRSDTMFGSLVVILPTAHTGGSLLLKHRGHEHMFDSASAVSGSSREAPCAAFVAFFSDVEHEVAQVTSGYRVTLTYNLYHTAETGLGAPNISSLLPRSGVATRNVSAQTEIAIKNALTSLLGNPTFLPMGGLLAFGLAYDYPFESHSTQLSEIGRRLKGTDAILKHACDELGLQASLKAFYRAQWGTESEDVSCFLDRFARTCFESSLGDQVEDSLIRYLCENEKGAIVGYDMPSGKPPAEDPEFDDYPPGTEVLGVVWANAPDDKNEFEENYVSYGNDATLGLAYGKVCLVVRVKPPAERISGSVIIQN
ncbi:hypothetical protein BDN70DRAFT_275955 [Pholiota conissans]|uniref:Fe2OG dioxygenase domain-containing protein n=1 Tax=Pholiota conissans TaxID=109636 RepID=A0A9P5YTZ8_9AGAR|nr:hypothetical protein BDN70DRAFT_275955 [Pholiota conissans]